MRVLIYSDDGRIQAQCHVQGTGISYHPSEAVAMRNMDVLAAVLVERGYGVLPPEPPVTQETPPSDDL